MTPPLVAGERTQPVQFFVSLYDGSWVGLDVHARKVVAGVLDGASGELRLRQVPHRSKETAAWLAALPRPVRVAYEAGPTGYGLARACEAAGIACTVAAPAKIPRAPLGESSADGGRGVLYVGGVTKTVCERFGHGEEELGNAPLVP